MHLVTARIIGSLLSDGEHRSPQKEAQRTQSPLTAVFYSCLPRRSLRRRVNSWLDSTDKFYGVDWWMRLRRDTIRVEESALGRGRLSLH